MPEIKTIKLVFQNGGDPSVGINGARAELDTGLCDIEEEDRKPMLDAFKEFCLTYIDEYGEVCFSDECQCCGKRLADNKCITENCPAKE